MCQKEDYLLQVTLDHPAIMMSMAGCQEQRRSVVGGEDGGQDDGVEFHHATQNGMKCIYLFKKWGCTMQLTGS